MRHFKRAFFYAPREVNDFLGSGRCHSCDRIVRRKVIRADSQSVPQFAGRSNSYDDHLVELSGIR